MNRLQNNYRVKASRPFSQKVVEALLRIKITVNPYIIFVEELSDVSKSARFNNKLYKHEIVFLDRGDMKTMEALPDRRPTEAELLNRLNEDKVCIALKIGQEIAAFTWFDLKECNIKGIKGPLSDNEAYLFDAYTLPFYRGKGIAPFIRYRSYQELNNQGKQRFLSFSDYFNAPAIRFKQKLKAKPIELRIAVRLRGVNIDLRLKRYGKSTTNFRIFYLRIRVKGVKVIESY